MGANTEYAFVGDTKAFSVNGAAGYTYTYRLTQPDGSIQTLASKTAQSGNITFTQSGTYILRVQATDERGCLSEPVEQIIIVTDAGRVSVKESSSNQCYSASLNAISMSLTFKDAGGSLFESSRFPVQLTYQINGVTQPAQTITYASQQLVVPGSSFTASPNQDTQVVVTLTGGTDAQNKAIQPETASGQHIHTHTIYALPQIRFAEPGVTTLVQGEQRSFTVSGEAGNIYSYTLVYPDGASRLLASTSAQTETVTFSKIGTYTLRAEAVSRHDCLSDPIEKTIVVNPATTDRLAFNDINITYKNMAVSGDVAVNDAGYAGVGASYSIYLKTINGTLTFGADGKYTYTPKTGFTGKDNFYYVVSTSKSPADRDTVNATILVLPDDPLQTGAVANDDEALVRAGQSVSGNVLANDFSPSGEGLVLNTTPESSPAHGTLVLNANGQFTYTPFAGYLGEDSFVYTVCEAGSGLCSTARVTLTVVERAQYPGIFAADDAVLATGSPCSGNLLDNDIFQSLNSLSVNTTPILMPGHGTVTIQGDGRFSYTPLATYKGPDRFVYEICDPTSGDCVKATVYIDNQMVPAKYVDLALTKTATANVQSGSNITYDLVVSNRGKLGASNVSLTDVLPAYILNPVYTLNNSAAKSWTGTLSLGNLAAGASETIQITAKVGEGAPAAIVNQASVSGNEWEPDYANNKAEATTVLGANNVLAVISGGSYKAVGSCADGVALDASKSIGTGLKFSWSPKTYLDDATSATPHFRPGKSTQYTLTVTDVNGKTSTATILVDVMPAPDAVTDQDVFVQAASQPVILNGTRSTGAGISYLWTTTDGKILDGATTAAPTVSGLGKYYLHVTDSLGCADVDSVMIGLYVQAINDTASTDINVTVDVNVLGNDIPKSRLNPSSLAIVMPPQNGVAMVVADSLIAYTPNAYYVGSDAFVYRICDYSLNCDQATVLVFVNDRPFFIPNAFSPNGDGINDTFEILGIAKYKQVSIQIFNRWGSVVYSSNNYGGGAGRDGFWDGRANSGVRLGNDIVPSGTYFYILTLDGKEKLSGSIYLDR